jgi:L,D-transpeptidase ErfK/SrfK
MKKNVQIFTQVLLARIFIISICITAFSITAYADTRSDAKEAVHKLRHTFNTKNTPDEVASIETTYSVAEQYFKQNSIELAEQYYLLTIQKAKILSSLSFEKHANVKEINSTSPLNSPSAILPDNPASRPKPVTSISGSINNQSTVVVATPADEQTSANADNEDSQDNLLIETIASEFMVGNPSTYVVAKNDTIKLIAAKLGVTRHHLMAVNKLNSKSTLKVGQLIQYNNRKIIPQKIRNGIVINIPEKTLYYFKNGKLTRSIPVALGVATKTKKFDWKTPTGKFKIVAKQKDPTWYVPPSIQEEMEDDGKEVIKSIPPGPTNPLGKYAFKTSLPGILIHSTIRPASIYSFASHGCIRVYPQHMEEFFSEVSVNTPGEIIYRPVKLANTETGRIFLEVHNDVYGKSAEPYQLAKQLIEKHKLSDRVNWEKVRSVIKQKAGIAEDITL